MKRTRLRDFPTTSKLTLIVVLLLLFAIIITIQRGLQKQNAKTMAQGFEQTQALTIEVSSNPAITEITPTPDTATTSPKEIQTPAQQIDGALSPNFFDRSVTVFAKLIDMSRKIIAGEN